MLALAAVFVEIPLYQDAVRVIIRKVTREPRTYVFRSLDEQSSRFYSKLLGNVSLLHVS